MGKKKIIVAITGASGSLYAKLLLDKLVELQDQIDAVAVVLSKNAKDIWEHELGEFHPENYPFDFYKRDNFFAPFASGSAQYKRMVIIPCSMGTLGRIANGISDDLIGRAADVILKEKRQLLIVGRDTPLHLIHIENMKKLAQAGAMMVPAIPSFYSKPRSVEELAMTVVNRILDLLELEYHGYRWGDE